MAWEHPGILLLPAWTARFNVQKQQILHQSCRHGGFGGLSPPKFKYEKL